MKANVQVWAVFFISVTLGCSNLFGQGMVHFGSDRSTLVINGITGQPVPAADGIKAAVYWSPLNSSNFVQLGLAVQVGLPVPGFYVGGTRATGLETPAGVRARFQVRVWESTYGISYEEALNAPARSGRKALVGQSAIIEAPTRRLHRPC